MKAIIIPSLNFSEVILIDNIIMCKGSGSYSEIFFKDKNKLVISKNLQWLENKLVYSGNFERVHKSYLVNVSHIKKIYRMENLLCLTNEIKIPISRTRKQQLFKFIEDLTDIEGKSHSSKHSIHS